MDRSELIKSTVKELRAEAEKLGVKRVASLRKSELVDAIVAVSDIAEGCTAGAVDAGAGSAAAGETKAAPSEPAAGGKKSASKKAGAAVKSVKTPEKSEMSGEPDATSGEDDDDDDAKDGMDAGEAVVEPQPVELHPVEPTSIFIDRGAILPEFVPGTCLYALVRDPGTLFVYWNADFESRNGWLLTAYDAAGNVLQSFTTPVRRNGRGYFRVPAARVTRVTLAVVTDQGGSEVRLESKIKIAQQLGIAQPALDFDERWVDIRSREVVYEAPSRGRVPAFQDVYPSMNADAVTAGGFDRSLESRGAGSASSRFGALNAPGSSDSFVASSGSIIRRS